VVDGRRYSEETHRLWENRQSGRGRGGPARNPNVQLRMGLGGRTGHQVEARDDKKGASNSRIKGSSGMFREEVEREEVTLTREINEQDT